MMMVFCGWAAGKLFRKLLYWTINMVALVYLVFLLWNFINGKQKCSISEIFFVNFFSLWCRERNKGIHDIWLWTICKKIKIKKKRLVRSIKQNCVYTAKPLVSRKWKPVQSHLSPIHQESPLCEEIPLDFITTSVQRSPTHTHT